MPTSAVDAISPAFQHAKQQLFQPFNVAQWAKLALVGFFAGELSSGGGCNAPNLMTSHPGRRHQLLSSGFPNLDPATLALLMAALIIAGFVLWVAFVYISSVMRFILFDSVIAKRCEILKGWSRRKTEGFRYFLWQIAFSVVTMMGMMILIGIPLLIALAAGWLHNPQEHLAPLILGGLLAFFILMAFILLSLIVHVFTKDFVIPQMALENIGAVEGWRRLLPRLSAEKGGYAIYVVMKVILSIAASVIFGIISLILILIILVPVGGMGVVAVLGGKAAGLHWDLYTITAAVVAACVVLAVLFYLLSLVSVPGIVFFPAYSIYFLASRYPLLASLLYPAPPSAPPPLPLPELPPQPIG